MKINSFQGDLIDTSAATKSLLHIHTQTMELYRHCLEIVFKIKLSVSGCFDSINMHLNDNLILLRVT